MNSELKTFATKADPLHASQLGQLARCPAALTLLYASEPTADRTATLAMLKDIGPPRMKLPKPMRKQQRAPKLKRRKKRR